MMKAQQQNRIWTVLIIAWYLVGTLGFLIPQGKIYFQQLTPVGMVLAAFVLMFFHEPKNMKSALAFGAVILSTFVVEAIGVNTQRLFGHYQYGPALGFQLWNTPVVIGLNWLVLVYCYSVLLKKQSRKWYFPLLGAAAMTAFDFLMEPVAMETGMWIWQGGIIPMKNYIDWFLLSALLFLVLRIFKIEFSNRFAGLILVMQTLFFALMNIFMRIL